jgi:NAD(P)-dependent dehydrogenase (short-subunit alcohol dehydrogenase family)
VAEAIARAVGAFGRLDGVVTCAGIFDGPDLQPIEDVPLDTFLHTLRVNLAGTFLAVKHAIPHICRDEGEQTGSVVTIASTAAIRGHGFGSGYTASKGGVAAFTRLVAAQCGPKGIRANCICPGGVNTPMAGDTRRTDEAIRRAKRIVPLGHVAEAEDIASVAGFLLSDDARHVTGQVFAVDGGVTST